jgi:hypothetical protein
MQREIADAFDQLASDFMVAGREPTAGATESHLAGVIARTLTIRAARLRAAADDAEFTDAQRRAQADAIAERTGSFDPADYSVARVNEHLRTADEAEAARVLALEAEDRPDVPDGRKQRVGILSGPHGAYQ